jgi:ribosomal protein S18 acetylase RimI-like enzyme
VGSTRFFLARETDGRPALGFLHLIPAINTVAMRPIWYLEDLYVAPEGRRHGVASALMRHAETFARDTGAERLTLATAHNNHRAQSLYKRLGYVREDHFWYYHRILD